MKSIEFAHSMHPSDGKWVGFIQRRVDTHTVTRIGRFEVDEREWDAFKKLMEPIAEFYWSFN